jgi:Icc-related predicted phosphoesterase
MFTNITHVGLAGDWHGNTWHAIQTLNKFKKQNITTIIQLGDFGIWGGQDSATFIRKVERTLKNNEQKLYIVLGNHENYEKVNNVPINEDTGLQHYRENIFFFPRGFRGMLGEYSFVTLGGANSIDKEWRTPYISWWAEESITLGEVYRTAEGGHADIMFTHDAPWGAPVPLSDGSNWTASGLRYAHEGQTMLRQAVDAVKPQILFHGHYHTFYEGVAYLNDGANAYETLCVGLSMDDTPNANAILNVDTLEYVVF